MKNEWFKLLGFIAGYPMLILFCEFLNRKLHIESEYTRKIAHILSVLVALTFPLIFADYRFVLAFCFLCAIAFFIANRTKILYSIDGVERETGGSYFLALGVGISYYLSVIFENEVLYNLPLIILAISDPLAGILGGKISSKQLINSKTLAGSLSFFVSTLIISVMYLCKTECRNIIGLSLFISFIATLIELLSPKGSDNMTVPTTVSAILIVEIC
jgi:dolichol kinase